MPEPDEISHGNSNLEENPDSPPAKRTRTAFTETDSESAQIISIHPEEDGTPDSGIVVESIEGPSQTPSLAHLKMTASESPGALTSLGLHLLKCAPNGNCYFIAISWFIIHLATLKYAPAQKFLERAKQWIYVFHYGQKVALAPHRPLFDFADDPTKSTFDNALCDQLRLAVERHDGIVLYLRNRVAHLCGGRSVDDTRIYHPKLAEGAIPRCAWGQAHPESMKLLDIPCWVQLTSPNVLEVYVNGDVRYQHREWPCPPLILYFKVNHFDLLRIDMGVWEAPIQTLDLDVPTLQKVCSLEYSGVKDHKAMNQHIGFILTKLIPTDKLPAETVFTWNEKDKVFTFSNYTCTCQPGLGTSHCPINIGHVLKALRHWIRLGVQALK